MFIYIFVDLKSISQITIERYILENTFYIKHPQVISYNLFIDSEMTSIPYEL